MKEENSPSTSNQEVNAPADINSSYDDLEIIDVKIVRRKSTREVITQAVGLQPLPPFSELGLSTVNECRDAYDKLAKPIMDASKESSNEALKGVMGELSKKKSGTR